MVKQIFVSVSNMIDYILDIRWYELPYKLLYIGMIICFGYCAALIVFCFPLAIIEAITKKKLNEKTENKIVKILSTCFSVTFLLMFFS